MKVAVITPDYPPAGIGGCATSSQLLVATLRKQHTVDAFVFKTWQEPQAEESGNTTFFAGKPKWLLWNNFIMVRRLWSALKVYDVVHVYNVSPVLAVVLLRVFGKLKKRAKIVMTLNNHNGAVASRRRYLERNNGKHPQKERFRDVWVNPEVPMGVIGAGIRLLEVMCIRWAGKRADAYIALTNRMKAEYVAAGYVPERFVVIPNMAIEEPAGKPTPLRQDRISLVSIGQLSVLKGQVELLDAFLGLPDELQQQCELYLLGKGSLEEELQRKSSQAENIYIQSVPHTEIASYIKAADVVVQIAQYPEPFSRVWLEAMVIGTPLLVSKTDGAVEVLGDAAVYCDPFSVDSIRAALKQYIEHADVRAQKADALRAKQPQFSQEQVEKHIQDFYEQL